MAKTYSNTRKGRANALLRLLERGPDFGGMCGEDLTKESAQRRYRLWAETWVLDQLRDLVPELRQEAARKVF